MNVQGSESEILKIASYLAKDVKVCNNGNVLDRLPHR
jgi:hypothetical protein